VDPTSETQRLIDHLRRMIGRSRFDLLELSRDRLQRAPDYLSKMLRGERTFRVEDLFVILEAVEVAPADFFAELYDLYRADDLGAEIAPGVFEGKVRRFVEEVARRAAREVAEAGVGRRRWRAPDAEPEKPGRDRSDGAD
jgi:hypothetical protein